MTFANKKNLIHKVGSTYKKRLYFFIAVCLCLIGLIFIVLHYSHGTGNSEDSFPDGDPFQTFYQESLFDKIKLEGTIQAISPIPDPKKDDYDHCLYTAVRKRVLGVSCAMRVMQNDKNQTD